MENKKLELMTQDLSAGYDGKTIVSDVSITIPKNKISVILGANGCGKSTLLKTFAKLLKPEKEAFFWMEKVFLQCRRNRWHRRLDFFHSHLLFQRE